MSQIPYRTNLQSMTFPLLSELSGRTVINPQGDGTYSRFVSADGQSPVDTGIPQAFYCHNVMPSTQGWQSVGYKKIFKPPIESFGLNFQSVSLVYAGQAILSGSPAVETLTSTGYKTYLSIAKSGLNSVFALNLQNNIWYPILNSPNLPENCVMTTATINGVTYIYFSSVGCYIYNNLTGLLESRPLLGLDAASTLGIVAANGYLNAWNRTGVAWSSTVDVEDFVPSDTSGAGGGQVQEAKGEIVTAVPTSLGYILYTKENAVSAIYSGNAEFPWNFKAIPSSGGISSSELVSQEQAAGYQQVYSTNGMQQITHARCNTVTPNITDFIAGNVFEDFNSDTNSFSKTKFDWSMRKKLAVVSDRYIVVSYGLDPINEMTHALVLDLTQSRMGKLKIRHNSCFELRSLNSTVTEIPRDSIAFIQKDGTVQVVDFSMFEQAEDSVLFLGKYQYVRQKLVELNSVEVECVELGDNFECLALPSLNGKNFDRYVPGSLYTNEDNLRTYNFDAVIGTNVTWCLKGTFNVNSILGWFSLAGNP